MHDKTLIALDIGRSAVKGLAYSEGQKFTLVFPSLVAPAVRLLDEEAAGRVEEETVTLRGRGFFTGETARLYGGAEHSAGLAGEWTDTNVYEALVRSAIKRFKRMGVATDAAYVVVGTPADLYALDRTVLENRTAAILGTDVKCLSQPLGSISASCSMKTVSQ